MSTYSGSEKEHQRSEAYQCSPCTPTLKQNIYIKTTGKSLEAMGVHIVDFGDVNGKKRNAATQTQEDDPEV